MFINNTSGKQNEHLYRTMDTIPVPSTVMCNAQPAGPYIYCCKTVTHGQYTVSKTSLRICHHQMLVSMSRAESCQILLLICNKNQYQHTGDFRYIGFFSSIMLPTQFMMCPQGCSRCTVKLLHSVLFSC
jgi:hypothetical protein